MPEERRVSFPSDNVTLEGILHLPESTSAPAIAVCHPHPQYGGDMHNNVVSAIYETALANGIAALRFNFRGTGAFDNGRGEVNDATGALAYLRSLLEIDAGRIALAGYSFGAAVAARAAASDLRCLLVVSLPTMMPLADVQISCPALFVSGDEDEYSDVDDLADFVRSLGPQAELRLLPGLGHFWWGVEHELAKVIAPFLRAHLPATTKV